MKVIKTVKKMGMTLLTFPMILSGYSFAQSQDWWYTKYHDLKKNKHSTLSEKVWAHRRGFLSDYVKAIGITSKNYKHYISKKDYHYIQPINEKFDKWIDDKVSILNIFKPFQDLFPIGYFHFYMRDGEWRIIPLEGTLNKTENSIETVFDLIKSKKIVALSTTQSKKKVKISYHNGKYSVNDVEKGLEELKDILLDPKRENSVLTEFIKPTLEFFDKKEQKSRNLRINIINDKESVISDMFIVEEKLVCQIKMMTNEDEESIYPVDIQTGTFQYKSKNDILVGKVPGYETLITKLKEIGLFVPEIEFMSADVIITDCGFKIEWLNPIPLFPKNLPFSEISTNYLRKKIDDKKQHYRKNKLKRSIKLIGRSIKNKVGEIIIKVALPKGFESTGRGILWIKEIFIDFKRNKSTSIKDKIWSYRHGFQSYRIQQYGLQNRNYESCISDLEYKWLQYLNDAKYRYWLEDKITMKHILSQYGKNFPSYYYRVMVKNGKLKVVSMMDSPRQLDADMEDIFSLVREKKILALKPDEGLGGEGFFKLTYTASDSACVEKYHLNDQVMEKEEIQKILFNRRDQYLITEYIKMHPKIKEIYSGAVSTLRVIVFKKDGVNPEIGDVYMRVGTSKTGGVDNMKAGGIAVEVDIQTGRFFNAKVLKDNRIVPCEYHPDTGKKIEGFLPNWEKIKSAVLEMATALSQLEYLGFDLAITEDGFKIPEINRSPGFPKIENLSEETMDYLLHKLELKKQQYGYEKKVPFSIIKLPKRDSSKSK